MLAAAWITAIATAGLFIGAVITAVFAVRAYRKQAEEVTDQAKLLEVQAGQLEEMRKVTAEQVTVLKLQAQELSESLAERKREAAGRHRAQAAKIFIAEDKSEAYEVPRGVIGVDRPPSVTAAVHNTSEQPVYDAELLWHRGSAGYGDPNPEPLATILPGTAESRTREFPPDTTMDVTGAVVRFRDASNIRWLRRPDGELIEQK